MGPLCLHRCVPAYLDNALTCLALLDDWYCKETLSGHTSTVWGVAADPSGDRIASVSDDKSVIIWQRHANSHEVAADGRYVPMPRVD